MPRENSDGQTAQGALEDSKVPSSVPAASLAQSLGKAALLPQPAKREPRDCAHLLCHQAALGHPTPILAAVLFSAELVTQDRGQPICTCQSLPQGAVPADSLSGGEGSWREETYRANVAAAQPHAELGPLLR